MEEKKKKIFSGQVPTAIFYILFGLCLALMPVETVNVLCKVIFGLVLIGAGVYHIVIFVLEKDNSTMLDLFSGVIVLVIGIFLFMNPTVVVKLLTLMLGAFILVDSIWMLRGSLKLKKRKQGVWKAFLVESLIFIGLGVLILVNPFSEIKMAVQVSGCIFVANGVLDIIFYFLLKHGLKKEIETEGENEKKKERKSQTEKSTELDSAAYEQNHGNAEARFGAENTAAGESFESAAETVDGSAFEREDSDVAANETASESQNEPEANESADTVSEEPEEEILEEWKD